MVATDHCNVLPARTDRLEQDPLPDRRQALLRAARTRQTVKTSALLALRYLLNRGAHGRYRCVYVNVEAGQAARENRAEAMRASLGELEIEADATHDDPLPANLWPGLLDRVRPGAGGG